MYLVFCFKLFQFRMYKIKSKGSEHPMKFRLCDTRGLEEGQGLDIVDLVAILDGHIADGYEVRQRGTVLFINTLNTFYFQ